ncbi:MAG: TonB-dependent receptor [Pseudomonadota bacterium]
MSLALAAPVHGIASSSIEEVVVRAAPPSELAPILIGSVRPRDASAAFAIVPGTAISTNSRGETLVSVRGRNEREATLTLDGIPLNDPWDQRIDLATLPASLIAEIDARPNGAVAIGSGSVLDLNTGESTQASAQLEAGDFGFVRGFGRVGSVGPKGGTLFTAELRTQDASPISDAAEAPFSQGPGRSRTNTSRQNAAAFIKASGKIDSVRVEGLALVTSTDYGVAPEAHLDPEIDRVRFWRIPKDQRVVGGLKVESGSQSKGLDLAVYGQSTRRQIDQFTNQQYQERSTREIGESSAVGLRGEGRFRAIAVGASVDIARHRERVEAESDDIFGRTTYAVWAKTERALNTTTAIRATLRREGFTTDRSGGRVESPDLGVTTGGVTITRKFARPLTIALEAARSARLPTQRELYGEALGRFVVNPELEPEKAWSSAVRFAWTQPGFDLVAEPFVELRTGPIRQTIVADEGGSLRQRINGPDATAYGLDFAANAKLARNLHFDVAGTFFESNGEDGAVLLERPTHRAVAALRYAGPAGVGFSVFLRSRGEAFSLGNDGQNVALPSAQSVDVEFSHRRGFIETFARLDNATDANIVPQLGLPAAGRSFRIGIRLTAAKRT